MTNFSKRILSTVTLLTVISFAPKAQTNVSGGIYSDVTWTKANSPYIVTDTVVVFPGYTLTIEPGVTVKFADNQELEIRQAELIAMGTATDSITFTSNSNSPTPGIYVGVYLNGGSMPSQIGYCNFYFAHIGIECDVSDTGFTMQHCKLMYNTNGTWSWNPVGLIDSCEIKYNTGFGIFRFDDVTNCTISNNSGGTYQCGTINNCVIDSSSGNGIYQNYGPISNCFIRNNNTGVFFPGTYAMYNCIITNNQTGIERFNNYPKISYCTIDSNSCGIFDNGIGDSITNCLIEYNDTGFCNPSYVANCRIQYNINGIINPIGTITKNIINDNSIGIQLDGVDSIYCNSICSNTSYNLKYESPTNTDCVADNYWCTSDSASIAALIYDGHDNINYGLVTYIPFDTIACSGTPTGIPIYKTQTSSFSIFPNPASDHLTLLLPENVSKGTIKVFNLLGELMSSSTIVKQETNMDVSQLASGIYIIEASYNDTIMRQKFIRE